MADTIGLYYKTGGAETGGTNSLTGLLTGGTRFSTGDTEASPFPFAELDTAYTWYYKAEDDATFDDAGKDTSAAFTITAPTGVQVCDTHNGTFASSVSVPAAVGVYKPVYAKQTARQASSEADLEVGTGGVTFVTGTRVAQVGTVTLDTSTAGQISASWDAVSGADGYQVQYKATASGTWLDAADVTSPSVITGLTNGVSYDVRVRAYSELGAGAWSATATATAGAFNDAFSTLDTARWGTIVSGSGTAEVVSDELVLTSPSGSVANAAAAYLKWPVPAQTLTFRHRVKKTFGDAAATAHPILAVQNGVPALNLAVTDRMVEINIGDDNGTGAFWTVVYWDNTGTVQRWNQTSGAFQTGAVENQAEPYAAYDTFVTAQLEVTATQWRMTLYRADGTTVIGQTSWVNWSATRAAASGKYIRWGDHTTSAWTATFKSDSFTVS